ncbi:GNAT family N-acetyltransferase [Phytomonospora sp. NPDC050363]|uniref:GNAT family N-acetyltransferase n=1 Tax=Phytomonospora sp. NPDC050363 TaxID=3155642 RepID=UPI0033ED7F0D
MIGIQRAEPRQLRLVLDILDEAAAWLRQRGIVQWPERFSDANDWRNSRIGDYVTAGETFLVIQDDDPVATFSLAGADPDYAAGWPGGPGDAVYLYRMAVRRAAAGRHLGDHILNWASAFSSGRGQRWLRLDCHRLNPVLQGYYLARGFAHVDTMIHTRPDGYIRGSGALFQRPAGTISLLSEHAAGHRSR